MFKDSLSAKDIKIENIITGNYTRLTFIVKAQNILVKCLYAPNENMTMNNTDNYSNMFFKTGFDDTDEEDFDIRLTICDFIVSPVQKKGYRRLFTCE